MLPLRAVAFLFDVQPSAGEWNDTRGGTRMLVPLYCLKEKWDSENFNVGDVVLQLF